MTEQTASPPRMPMARRCPFDPPDELIALHEEGRLITPMTFPDGAIGWLVTGHALTRAVLTDRRFSARGALRRSAVMDLPTTPEQPGVFVYMDAPEHTRLRKLVVGQFTARRLKQLESRIEQIVADQLDAMERHGSPADLMREYAIPVPSTVICELLGIPYDEYEYFLRRVEPVFDIKGVEEEVGEIYQEVYSYLLGLVARKRAEPGTDIISGLITNQEAELSDDELVGMSFMMLLAGFETTAHMLGLGTFLLFQHPDQMELLRNDPSVVDTATEELLRYLTITQYDISNRTALEDVELGGVLVKKGQTVAISLPAANRDPARFPDRTGSTSPGSRPVTSPSATACTSASGSSWAGWNCASRCPPCCGGFPRCGSVSRPKRS